MRIFPVKMGELFAHFDNKYSHFEKIWKKNPYFSSNHSMIFVSAFATSEC